MPVIDPQFAYMNARVRSLKSLLFTRARLEEFLHQNDLAKMIDALLDSPYHEQMAEALSHNQGADAVEEAVTRNLVATARLLTVRAAGRPREFLDLFLRRWDLNSVKSLLRVRHQGLDLDEALGALAPGAHMPPGVQRRLAQCETVGALCGQLIVWDSELCGGLSAALPAYSATRDLALLDEALDRHYFVRGAARLKDAEDQDSRLLHFFFQLEIDRINLRLIFERLREPAPVPASMDRLLPEGTLAPALLRRLIEADDAAQAAEMLGGTRYRDFLEELYQFMQTHRFSPVERLFEQALLRELRRLAVRDPLGLAVAMDYSWRKYNEGINLRLIARGLAGHLPSGRVREELVFV